MRKLWARIRLLFTPGWCSKHGIKYYDGYYSSYCRACEAERVPPNFEKEKRIQAKLETYGRIVRGE